MGCGRCIVWCPTGIDITQEVSALASLQRPADTATATDTAIATDTATDTGTATATATATAAGPHHAVAGDEAG